MAIQRDARAADLRSSANVGRRRNTISPTCGRKLTRAPWPYNQATKRAGAQQLKEELGLDHFEGRSWKGLHRHALMTMIAYAFLQYRRYRLGKAVSPAGQCNSRCCAIIRRSSPISSRRESKFVLRLRHRWTNSNARFLRAIC